VIQGVVTVDVNVTDEDHEYATPTENDSTKLTSASSGPARILYKPSGTGTKRCAVRLDETGSGGAATLTHDHENMPTLGYTITADNTWEGTGLVLTLPSAGTYFVYGKLSFYAQLSTLGTEPAILARVTGGPSASQGESQIVGVKPFSTGVRHFGFGTFGFFVDATGVTNLEVEVFRTNSGGTWTTSTIGRPGFTSDNATLGYFKVG
jgi:hypothetical protein